MDAGPVAARGKVSGREALSINPEDAAERGIEDGEIVRVFNGRGACFAGAVFDRRGAAGGGAVVVRRLVRPGRG